MTPGEREALIARYLAGAGVIREAVATLTPAELDARSGGEWSPRQVVHHLADAETIAASRVRRLVAEEDVEFISYDEALWAEKLHRARPVETALTLIAAVRADTAAFLRELTEDEWLRAGTHSHHHGPYTPESWLQYYADHAHDHAIQIAR
jgi:hypothetical protein